MTPATTDAVPLVELRGIGKRFGEVTANEAVDFTVYPGEIHALLGENGAGKTTLMNILYGLYQPDAGEILIKGRPLRLQSAQDAIRHGLEMVHQHFQLVPSFSVIENVTLGRPSGRWPLLEDERRVRRRISDISNRYRLQIDPGALIWQLSVGQQQRVEILKALYRGAEVLILDEPTAVLTPEEAADLLRIIGDLAAQGTGIVFISHKLNEVLAVSDRITVLRDGRVVGVTAAAGSDRARLVRAMVGREISFELPRTPARRGEPRLVVTDLEVRDDRGLPALRGVGFAVHSGEILGLAGVDGNGQRELEDALRGLRAIEQGRIEVAGRDIARASPAEIIALGVGHIPSDRYRHGLLGAASVAENAVLERFWRPPYARRGLLDWDAIRDTAARLVQDYDVRPPQPQLTAAKLSGGNAQKLVLARELDAAPQVLIAAQPTRGLDINAIQYVHRRLLEQRDRGVAIVLISTELEEIFNLSDRIAVLFEGRIMAIVPGERRYQHQVGQLMAGHQASAA